MRKVPRGISIITSTSGGSDAASGAGDGMRFASFIPKVYLNPADSTNGVIRRAGHGALCRAGNYYAAPRRLDRKMKLLSKQKAPPSTNAFDRGCVKKLIAIPISGVLRPLPLCMHVLLRDPQQFIAESPPTLVDTSDRPLLADLRLSTVIRTVIDRAPWLLKPRSVPVPALRHIQTGGARTFF